MIAGLPTTADVCLMPGDRVTVTLEAKVVYPPRESDGRMLVETDEGTVLIVDRFVVDRSWHQRGTP